METRGKWETCMGHGIRHYNNVTQAQAEPNDALQALTAQILDRGWRWRIKIAARKRSGADGETGK